MAAIKGAAVVLVMVALLLLMPLAAMADPVSDQGKATAAALQEGTTKLLPPELGNCAPPLFSCASRPCCDEKNFGCSYTKLFGVDVAATCRPLTTCKSTACTLNSAPVADTLNDALFPPKP
ncbi:unnamed protein product [Urochloa decumbens]|uniref:Uncharacterized protein n=1 Tax=Urochloa decumbens TaxID=240449 RepID=A0ABC9GDC0_9POAL